MSDFYEYDQLNDIPECGVTSRQERVQWAVVIFLFAVIILALGCVLGAERVASMPIDGGYVAVTPTPTGPIPVQTVIAGRLLTPTSIGPIPVETVIAGRLLTATPGPPKQPGKLRATSVVICFGPDLDGDGVGDFCTRDGRGD